MLEIVQTRPVITADVCVIEEQQDHLVLAVRVPRASIEANKEFLGYLAGVSVDSPAMPQKLPLARLSGGRVRKWLAAAAIAAMAIITWEFGELNLLPMAQADNGPAFVWGSARFVSDIIPQNGTLEIIASHKYLKACDWHVTRKWYLRDKMIAITKIQLPPIPVSQEFMTRRWQIEIPRDLSPEVYSLKATLHGICPGSSDFFENDIFEQNFRVVAGGG